jgi:hypothetical protein
MSNSFQNSVPPEEDNISCYFSSYIDINGDLLFGCGWSEKAVDLENFALLLFNISTGKITEEIMKDIKYQCLSSGKIEEFSIFEKHFKEMQSMDHDDDDDIVISPLSIDF